MRLPQVLITGFLLALGPAEGGSPGIELEVGRPFPRLVLPALANGRPMSVADSKGERVVLQVFASW